MKENSTSTAISQGIIKQTPNQFNIKPKIVKLINGGNGLILNFSEKTDFIGFDKEDLRIFIDRLEKKLIKL